MLLHDSPARPSVIFQLKEKWLQQADELHTAVSRWNGSYKVVQI